MNPSKRSFLRRAGHGMALLAAAAAFASPLVNAAKLKVVTTTADFAAIARDIGGDRIEVASLAKPTEDSHFVDAKPSLILKLNRADVLIEGGAELEIGWLPALMDSTRNPRIHRGSPGNVLANEGIAMLDVPAVLDRSMGGVHAMGNPHIMTDPVNARILAEHLARVFSQLDAQSSEFYRANFQRFSDELDAKLAEWQQRLAPFKGRRIVAYHDSWPYFARRFGLRIDLFLEPKPGIPPTPPHLAQVIQTMQQEKINLIFVEPHLNWRTAETVARQTGATAVLVSQFPGGVKGTEGGYIPLIEHLVDTVAKNLKAP
ncbi:MAG TPA: metal ABC transporter substrate-binding protein [Verrucomicrobiota bacterium]|nr:metal ABC transporter substrate-binding protein [Verrucomicrobiota bacterium]HNU52053.1 metal ABC transporter substrate-binding protein [Verrucomicrobiota bacterium]